MRACEHLHASRKNSHLTPVLPPPKLNLRPRREARSSVVIDFLHFLLLSILPSVSCMSCQHCGMFIGTANESLLTWIHCFLFHNGIVIHHRYARLCVMIWVNSWIGHLRDLNRLLPVRSGRGALFKSHFNSLAI